MPEIFNIFEYPWTAILFQENKDQKHKRKEIFSLKIDNVIFKINKLINKKNMQGKKSRHFLPKQSLKVIIIEIDVIGMKIF